MAEETIRVFSPISKKAHENLTKIAVERRMPLYMLTKAILSGQVTEVSKKLLGLGSVSRSIHTSLTVGPEILRTLNSSRLVIRAKEGVITISPSPLDCVFCGAVAFKTFHGRGVCLACIDDARRMRT